MAPFAPPSQQAAFQRSRQQRGAGFDPVTLLSLLCLDAPLVAITWQWAFAHTFGVAIFPTERGTLFLTAWVIYLSDRLADTLLLRAENDLPARHRFCRAHRGWWLAGLTIVGALDALLVWQFAPHLFLRGSVLGFGALVYLLLNSLGRPWRRWPIKEAIIAILFAAGTVVVPLGRLNPVTPAAWLALLFFALLCWLNCIGIARWEVAFDRQQERDSFATRLPRFLQSYRWLCALAAAGSMGAAICFPAAFPVLMPIALSALALGLLDYFGNRWPSDRRTALADLVLLTPVFFA